MQQEIKVGSKIYRIRLKPPHGFGLIEMQAFEIFKLEEEDGEPMAYISPTSTARFDLETISKEFSTSVEAALAEWRKVSADKFDAQLVELMRARRREEEQIDQLLKEFYGDRAFTLAKNGGHELNAIMIRWKEQNPPPPKPFPGDTAQNYGELCDAWDREYQMEYDRMGLEIQNRIKAELATHEEQT